MATTGQLSKGGIGALGEITVFHTGEAAPSTTTTGNDTTPVVTETYVARVFTPVNGTLTGIAILNGSAVAGNVTAILYDYLGRPITQSASTAQAGTAAYQLIPFPAVQRVRGPALHFIGLQFNNTSARFRTHILGAFTAFKVTGEVYGTATTLVSPNTFTTAVGPVASTY